MKFRKYTEYQNKFSVIEDHSLFQNLWKIKTLGIKGTLSTAYHSQTDGQIEWMN